MSRRTQPPDPPSETDDTTSAAAINPSVTYRIRRGVSQLQPRCANQARIPLADAVAVIAPIMHWMHMTPTQATPCLPRFTS
jgi:hypothetical protein